MPREIQPIQIDAHGTESHPAFGVVRVNRSSYGGSADAGTALYGSDVKHQHTVRLRVQRSTRDRAYGKDHMYERGEVLDIEFSESQWSAVIASMNNSGVPCTIRYVTPNGQGEAPALPYEARLLRTQQAARDAAKEAFAEIEAATKALSELGPKAGIKDRREAQRRLESAVYNSASNVAYASRVLAEQTEDTINRARADIEAIAMEAARRHGVPIEGAPTLALDGGNPVE